MRESFPCAKRRATDPRFRSQDLKAAAAAQGLGDDEDDGTEPAAATSKGKKRGRRTSGTSTPRKKPKKQDVPPLFLPQSELITGGTLKPYQLDGQNWMIQRYIYAMHGAIVSCCSFATRLALPLIPTRVQIQLADEMGTGKTLQSISLLAFIHDKIHEAEKKSTDRPSIVILPKAVLYNWALELERYASVSPPPYKIISP